MTEPAFATHVGKFVSPTSTGDQTVTGCGFTPLAVIIFTTWNGSGTTGWSANTQACQGFCATDGTQGYIAQAGKDAGNPAVEERRWSSGGCCGIINYDGTLFNEATIKSFNSDGFVLTWGTVWATAGINYNYIAIGGSDVTNAKIVSWDGKAGTGTQDITGVGFQPDLVMHLSSGSAHTSPYSETYNVYTIGAMDGAGNQWCEYGEASPGSPTNTVRVQMTDGCIVDTGAGTAVYNKAAFSAMIADGFRVNWTTYGASRKNISLCMKGGQYLVGALAKTTNAAPSYDSTATTAKIGKGMLFASDSYTAKNDAGVRGGRLMVGASDGINNAVCGITSKDAVTTSVAKKFQYVDHSILIADNDTQTNNTQGKIAVFGPTTVTSVANPNQGIATDGTNYYGWTSTVLYKYDTAWNVVASRNIAAEFGVGHMGGGDVYNGVIYIAGDDRTGSTTTNARIGRWNCSDLSFVGNFDISGTISGAQDCGGCAVDPADGWIFVAPYYGSTTYIYKFALSNGAYVATISQNPTLGAAQDIAYYNGRLYVMSDPSTGCHGTIKSMDLTGATQITELDVDALTTNQLEFEGIWVDSTGIHMLGIINPATSPDIYIFFFGKTDGFTTWYDISSATAHQVCYILFGVPYATASVSAVRAQAASAARVPTVSGAAGVTAVRAQAASATPAPALTTNNILAAVKAAATATAPAPSASGTAAVTAVKAEAAAVANAPSASGAAGVAAVRAQAASAAPVPVLTSDNILAAIVAAATATSPAPVLTTNNILGAVAATATADAHAPDVSGEAVIAAVMAAATAIANAPTLGVQTVIDAIINAAVAEAVADVIAPTASGAAGVTAVKAEATADAQVPVPSGAAGVDAVSAEASADAPAPVLISDNILAAVVATATAESYAPSVSGDAEIAAAVATAIAEAYVPSINTEMAVIIAAAVAAATADSYAPSIDGDVWADVFIDAFVAEATADAPTPSPSGDAGIDAVVAEAAADATAPDVFGDALISAVVAEALADAIAPEITEYQGIEIGSVVAAASAVAIVPEIYGEILNVPYCEPEVDFDGTEFLVSVLGGVYAEITSILAQDAGTTAFIGSYIDKTELSASEAVEIPMAATYDNYSHMEGILTSTRLVGFIRCKV